MESVKTAVHMLNLPCWFDTDPWGERASQRLHTAFMAPEGLPNRTVLEKRRKVAELSDVRLSLKLIIFPCMHTAHRCTLSEGRGTRTRLHWLGSWRALRFIATWNGVVVPIQKEWVRSIWRMPFIFYLLRVVCGVLLYTRASLWTMPPLCRLSWEEIRRQCPCLCVLPHYIKL